MRILQSRLVTTFLVLLTIVFTFLVGMMEFNRRLFTNFFLDPSISDLELIIFCLALPIVTCYLTLASCRTIAIDSAGVRLTRLFGKDELSEEEISWISSGKGWLYIESKTGRRLGYKIFFGHKNLNSQQVAKLESAFAEMKERVRARYPGQTSTVVLKGIFRIMPIVFLAILGVFIVPVVVAIWISDTAFLDAIIISVLLPLIGLLGVAIPSFFIGTLTEVRVTSDTILLKYPFRKVKLSRDDKAANAFTVGERFVSTADGKRNSLRGLTMIGEEKMASVRGKWFA